MNVAIILAGGIGSRVGADIPKQFIKIEGHPIIAYTIKKFEDCEAIDAIEVVCHHDYIEVVKEIKKTYSFNKIKWITEGGSDFQHSVMNGVFNLKEVLNENDIVSIHFSASPFVSNDIILDSIRVARQHGNAISTCPCYLLYGTNDGEKSLKWVDRRSIVTMSTPHSFIFNKIMGIYDRGIKNGIIDSIEPHTTTLMYKLNEPVYFSRGNQTNIKITTKEDLELFRGFVLVNNIKLL